MSERREPVHTRTGGISTRTMEIVVAALIIAVGGIVCILALGVMLPMWEMISRVQV